MPRSDNRQFDTVLNQAGAGTSHALRRLFLRDRFGTICRMLCLTSLVVIQGFHESTLRAQEPVIDWKTTQQRTAALVSQCQFDEAVQELSAFIKINPNFAPAYEQRIWVVLDWLDLRDEFSLTDVPLRRRSFSDPAAGLGNIDPPEEARRVFLNDRWIENYVLPMEMKSVQQDLVECRRLAGKSFDERAIEAFLAEFTGNLDRAQELIGQRCQDGTAKPREYLTQMRLCRVRGDFRGLLAAADAAWKSPETRNQAASRRISLLRSQNRNREMLEAFELWKENSPNDARFLQTRSAISISSTTEFKDLQRLMELIPNEPSFPYALSVRDIQINNDSGACLAHLDRAVETSRRSLIPLYARSCLKIKLGDFKGALADATAAIERNSYFDLSYQVRARVLRKMGDNEMARADEHRRVWLQQLYERHSAYKSKPDSSETSYELGKHYANGEDWEMAIRAFTTSVEASRRPVSEMSAFLPLPNVNALRARSQAYVAVGKLDLALSDADAVVGATDDLGSYSLRGDIHALRSDWDRAVKDYERCRLLDDRLEQALRKRAAWHTTAGRVEQAKADLERASQVAPAVFIAP